jgi:copper(I)-binding protein
MNSMIALRAFVLCLCAWLCACSAGNEAPIEIHDARSPAMPPGSSVVAVYAEITAHQPDTLLGVATPVAETADMHTTLERGGMMHMEPLAELPMTAGETVRFEPGGKHIMLSGPRQVLPVGTQFPLTLRFAVAGEVTVEVNVVAPGTRP